MLSECDNIKHVEYFVRRFGSLTYEVFYEKRRLKRQYSYERGLELYDDIIRVKIENCGIVGFGECSPFQSFFNLNINDILDEFKKVDLDKINKFSSNRKNIKFLSPVSNAIDAALIDLKCKQTNQTVFDLFGMGEPKNVVISHTVEYENLDQLKVRLNDMVSLPILKVKLGSDNLDEQRLEMAKTICPNADIVVDVNEGWGVDHFKKMIPVLLKYGVTMVEQPLKREFDSALMDLNSPIPVYADESFHTIGDIDRLSKYYDGFNIKLDKIGGLMNAIEAAHYCKKIGKGVMVGCLGGTSMSSTAGFVAAQYADFVDLDNHLWLSQDLTPSLGGEDGIIRPPKVWLWGGEGG